MNLARWLATATRGLSDESRARISGEIVAHVEDAVDDASNTDAARTAAQADAVSSLGSPQQAAQQFRSTYLTRFEDASVREIAEPQPAMPAAYLVFGALVAWSMFRDDVSAGAIATVLACILGSAAVLSLIAPRLYQRGYQRRAIALGGLAMFVLWSSILIGVQATDPLPLWRTGVAMIAVIMLIAYLPALRKLGNNPEASSPQE